MRNQRYSSSISSFPGQASAPRVVPHFLRKGDNLPLAKNSPQFQPRVALYSGGSDGEALRRNIAIAHSLEVSHLKANVLLITEPHQNPTIPSPQGLTCIHLPADTESEERSQLALEALASFSPDAVVIDSLPFGLRREFDCIINLLKRSNIRCVLGLESGPTHTIPEQAQRLYDQIWAYCDRDLYDFSREYNFTNGTRKKICHTGYLDHLSQHRTKTTASASQTLILFMLDNVEDYADASETLINTPLPPHSRATLITGTNVPIHIKTGLRQLTSAQDNIEVVDDCDKRDNLLAQADFIVAMGNHIPLHAAEVNGKATLLIPAEQKVCRTTKRLAKLNVAEVVNMSETTTETISNWLHQKAESDHSPNSQLIDCKGLSRLPGLLGALLTTNRRQPSRQVV